MGFKTQLEHFYEGFFDKVRSVSAQKTRIKQFKNKSNRKSLSAKQIKEIKAFYKPYKIPNLVFHRYFTEKTGVFCANYIPQDLYVGYIDPYLNDLHAAKHLDNKCYYDLLFHQIPQPHLVLKRINGIWLNRAGLPLDTEGLKNIVAAEKEGLFVKEAQVSAGGHGVEFVGEADDAFAKISEFASKTKTDIVVQRKLTQHNDLAQFNPSSVNSLRIYSVLKKDGTAKIYSAVLRMGVGDSKVDNYASGGVSCGITAEGTLRQYAYNKKGERTEVHPFTKISFAGCKIPSWELAVNLVKRTHPTIPHFRSVSWDIAINEQGEAVLIEANLCRGGIDLLQLSNGPLFGEDTKEILDEVFGN